MNWIKCSSLEQYNRKDVAKADEAREETRVRLYGATFTAISYRGNPQ